MTNKPDNDKLDRLIARGVRREIEGVPESPWFTRKVLNRLPRRHRPVSRLEMAAYVVGLVGLGWYAWSLASETASSGVVTVGTLVGYLLVGIGSVAIIGSIAWASLFEAEGTERRNAGSAARR